MAHKYFTFFFSKELEDQGLNMWKMNAWPNRLAQTSFLLLSTSDFTGLAGQSRQPNSIRPRVRAFLSSPFGPVILHIAAHVSSFFSLYAGLVSLLSTSRPTLSPIFSFSQLHFTGLSSHFAAQFFSRSHFPFSPFLFMLALTHTLSLQTHH